MVKYHSDMPFCAGMFKKAEFTGKWEFVGSFFQSKSDQTPVYTVNSHSRNPRKMYELKYFRQIKELH